MNDILIAIGSVFVVAGVVFDVIGCIGIVRMSGVYARLQAGLKCVTLGTVLMLVGILFLSTSGPLRVRVLISAVIVAITAPAAAHLLARASQKYGVKVEDQAVAEK